MSLKASFKQEVLSSFFGRVCCASGAYGATCYNVKCGVQISGIDLPLRQRNISVTFFSFSRNLFCKAADSIH